MHVALRMDQAGATRCPYCHDAVGCDAIIAVCGACEAVMHFACRGAHGRCATLGCAEVAASRRRTRPPWRAAPPPHAPRSRALVALQLLVGAATIAMVALVPFALRALDPTARAPLSPGTIADALVVSWSVIAAHALCALRRSG